MKLVVCDDDATLRGVVSRLAESVGHSVIAETDSAEDAVQLVSRFGAEGLVLDLSLPWGSGMTAVRSLRDRAIPCQIVLFTAYAAEEPELRDAVVRAVVEKPDFDQLEDVLRQLIESPTGAPVDGGPERRRTPRPRPRVPAPEGRTPSGLEAPEAISAVVEVLEADDGVLVVHLADVTTSEARFDRLAHTDRLLAVARELRTQMRAQDRLGVEGDQLLGLLLDGGRPGIESLWRRVEAAHQRAQIGGVLSAGWAVHEELESPFATVQRALSAAQRSIGHPPGDRLWAG
jgi:CheY-like chemotaxis protein